MIFSTDAGCLNTMIETYTKVNIAIITWQSNLSVNPPCPGIVLPKSLILNARLNPLAKNPPNGARVEAKSAITNEWNCTGANLR